MSNSKRRNLTKQKLNQIPSATLKELMDEGLIQNNVHLTEWVDIPKCQTNKGWWKRMSVDG